MYKGAICENEIFQVEQLSKLFFKIEKEEHIKFHIDEFSSGEALLLAGYEKYDFVILDIKMKGLTGIEVAKRIRKENEAIKIIFIAEREEEWAEGYRVNAYRYMIKPIDEEDFCLQIINLIQEMNKNRKFVLIRNEKELRKILISDIKYLEIVDRKVVLHSVGGVYRDNLSFRKWKEKLSPYGFSNPHNSYLVNLKYVEAIDKEYITLSSDEKIYVSQRKYKAFKDKFIKYVGDF